MLFRPLRRLAAFHPGRIIGTVIRRNGKDNAPLHVREQSMQVPHTFHADIALHNRKDFGYK